MIKLFHEDSEQILKNPNGKIVINDGRNYIFLTKKNYDVVTIDPPPPFNAAGTTVLYSKEFYGDISKKLNQGGIVSQWIWFGSQEADISMAIKSFTDVFPYVLIFQTPSGRGGVFLEGSFSPMIVDEKIYQRKILLQKPNEDLKEFYSDLNLSQVFKLLTGDRESANRVVSSYPAITDNFPRTEYFIIRHNLRETADLTKPEQGKEFIKKLHKDIPPLVKE